MIRWVSRTSPEPRDGARVFTMTLSPLARTEGCTLTRTVCWVGVYTMTPSPFARAEECTLTPTLCWVGLRVRVLWLGPGWVRMFTVNPSSGVTW